MIAWTNGEVVTVMIVVLLRQEDSPYLHMAMYICSCVCRKHNYDIVQTHPPTHKTRRRVCISLQRNGHSYGAYPHNASMQTHDHDSLVVESIFFCASGYACTRSWVQLHALITSTCSYTMTHDSHFYLYFI